jgi:two-component system sensor histidine kinase UhpB
VLYRVAEEAVANAARHARASRVVVRLRADAGWVELSVGDDGRGFAVKNADLLGMRQRLALVGGQLEVTSAPGRGTTVRGRVPADAATATAVGSA